MLFDSRIRMGSPLRLERNCGQAESGDRGAVAAGRNPQLADECAGHMALIGESSQYGGVGRGLPCDKKPPRQAHTLLNKICVRSDSHLPREAP